MRPIKAVLFALASLSLAAHLAAAELVHNPILSAAAGQDIVVQVNLVGAPNDARARLFFRPKGKEIYRSLEMLGPSSSLEATIPGSAVDVAGLEYYIEASTIAGSTKTVLGTAPSSNPTLNPYPVAVRNDETGPEVTPLSPLDGDVVENSRPVFTAAWADADSGVDPSTALVKIDGEAVKDKDDVQPADSLVTYIPKEPLADGEHEITVVVKDKSGNAGSIKWKVTISATAHQGASKAAAKKWFWDGRLSAETAYGPVLQQPSSAQLAILPYRPYGANRLNLEVNGRGEDDTVSLKIFKTDEERSDQQPVDRYTATWKNREGQISLGDISAQFSELSLFEVPELRGVGLDLQSGALNEGHTRLVSIFGQTERAVEQGATGLSGAPDNATLAQYLYGARWEFGGPYFKMGFNSVTINDDETSVSDPGSTLPHYNSLLTSDVHIGLPIIYLTLNGEAGADSFGADASPLGLSVGSAYTAGADWNIKPWSTRLTFTWRDLGGGYGLLPGGYSTLANPGLIPDYRGYESEFSQGLFDNQFSFNLGLNNWHDNLQSQKPATTTTNFVNVGVGIQPRNLPNLNVGYTLNTMVNDASEADASGNSLTGNFKLDQKTSSVTVGLGYTKPIDAKTSASLNVNWVGIQSVDQAALHASQDLNANNYTLAGFFTHDLSTYSASLGYGTTAQPLENPTLTLGSIGFSSKAGTSVSGGLRWNQIWGLSRWDSFLAWDVIQSHNSSDASSFAVSTSADNGRQTYSLGGGYKISDAQKVTTSLAVAMVNVSNSLGGVTATDSLTQMLASLRYDLTF